MDIKGEGLNDQSQNKDVTCHVISNRTINPFNFVIQFLNE